MTRSNHPSEVLDAESHAQKAASDKVGAAMSRHAPRRKIFFLLDSLNVGGTEVQAVELALRLDPGRYDITLGCLRVRGPLLERLKGSSVAVRQFYPKGGADSIRGVCQIFRLAWCLRRERYQIFHAHDLYANVMGIPAAVLARVPVIISSQRDLAHLDLYRTKRRVWLRRLQKLASAVLTNANAVREAVLAEGHFAPGKVRVIHNGVDLERFSRRSNDRNWLTLSTGEKCVVLVGSMYSDVKGHPTLIQAAAEVVREFPGVHFLLVGDGVRRKDFESLVERRGLQSSFHFLGRRDDVPRILSCCDIAVLPSKAEGLPNAVLEYLAAGLPTIATSVGGNVEILQNEKTGLLIPPEDSSALAQALLRLLRDPVFASELGNNGRDFVAAEFSFQRMIEHTDQMYTELLHARGVE